MTCEEWANAQDKLDGKARLIGLMAHLYKVHGGMRRGTARRAARRWWNGENF